MLAQVVPAHVDVLHVDVVVVDVVVVVVDVADQVVGGLVPDAVAVLLDGLDDLLDDGGLLDDAGGGQGVVGGDGGGNSLDREGGKVSFLFQYLSDIF